MKLQLAAGYPDSEKWVGRKFTGYSQDVHEWTDERTGEYYPPTYAWIGTISAKRTHPTPDAEFFYLRISVSGKKDTPLDFEVAKVVLEQGLVEFDSYANCACRINKNCVRHGGRP